MRRGLRDGIGSRRLEVDAGGGLSPEEVGSVPKRWGLSPRKEIGLAALTGGWSERAILL